MASKQWIHYKIQVWLNIVPFGCNARSKVIYYMCTPILLPTKLFYFNRTWVPRPHSSKATIVSAKTLINALQTLAVSAQSNKIACINLSLEDETTIQLYAVTSDVSPKVLYITLYICII